MALFPSVAGPAGWVDRFGAGKPRKGCDILVQALEREGVDTGGECVGYMHSSSGESSSGSSSVAGGAGAARAVGQAEQGTAAGGSWVRARLGWP